MKTKDNTISLAGLQLPMRKVLKVVDIVYKQHGQEAVITAGTEVVKDDGKFIHSAGSFHPFGFALDFRTYYFTQEEINLIKPLIQKALGEDYDVIFETNHFHIEYDPKGI
jgi:hypothetical protein